MLEITRILENTNLAAESNIVRSNITLSPTILRFLFLIPKCRHKFTVVHPSLCMNVFWDILLDRFLKNLECLLTSFGDRNAKPGRSGQLGWLLRDPGGTDIAGLIEGVVRYHY